MVASLCYFSANCIFYMENAADTPWMWEFVSQNECVSRHVFYFASASLPCGEVSGKDISLVHFCSLGPFVLLVSLSAINPRIFCIIPERRLSAFWKGTLEGQNEGSCSMAMSLQNHIMIFMTAFSPILLRYSHRTFPCVWGREVDVHNALKKISSVKLQGYVLKVEKHIRVQFNFFFCFQKPNISLPEGLCMQVWHGQCVWSLHTDWFLSILSQQNFPGRGSTVLCHARGFFSGRGMCWGVW